MYLCDVFLVATTMLRFVGIDWMFCCVYLFNSVGVCVFFCVYYVLNAWFVLFVAVVGLNFLCGLLCMVDLWI